MIKKLGAWLCAWAFVVAVTCPGLAQDIREPFVLVPLGKAAREVPLFFSASAEVEARVSLEEVTSVQRLAFTIHQGQPSTLALSLSGPGEIVAVSGEGLRDWALRIAADGARFLDLRPHIKEGEAVPQELRVVATTRHRIEDAQAGVLLPGPGSATGFSLVARVAAEDGVDLRLLAAEGLTPVEGASNREFVSNGDARLLLQAASAGSGARGIELRDAALAGDLAEDGESILFRLIGFATSEGEGSAVELFSGGAALADGVNGDGWHVSLTQRQQQTAYDLTAERAGELRINVGFAVPVTREGDWHVVDFRLPAGVAVPLHIGGLAQEVNFDRGRPVVPQHRAGAWRGFLPADGSVRLAWRETHEVEDGSLFFSGSEITELRVGSGLLRQSSQIDLRILQGRLPTLSFLLEGTGEVLSVEGEAVVGWSVRENEGARLLEVNLSRPIESDTQVRVEAQAALGPLPVKVEPLRLSPVGALRHSGWIRVANEGAVRIEVANAEGLVQMPPNQFPAGADESLRQVFAYRFPSTARSYVIAADQIVPEVAVNEVTLYEVGETDQRILSEIELDIREAPLREFEVDIPGDHAVAAASGAAVADYALDNELRDGMKRLKILFREPVAGRQLLGLILEKNQAAAAGPWTLVPLEFPVAKSRRGYIGAVAAAGYRLTVTSTEGLAEAPVSFFPKQAAGLQQAFRIREGSWSAALEVEALGRSVQADVFHLYSLKAGAAYGSVLINYFVVGAPSNEWRIRLPEEIGNVDVTGQNVGRDWRREGEMLVVPLSRPVLGAGTLLLTFEQPMSARGGSISPGNIRPLEVQDERGYVQVVSPLHVKYEITRSSGSLLSLAASELPTEFRLLSNAPTLAAWQYTSPAFEIGIDIEWFETAETVDQVIDFLSLSTRLSKDGQWVTDARLFAKSRQSQPLRMSLPPGASLWEASINGERVNARTDGSETLVPMTSADPHQAVEVILRYGAPNNRATRVQLAAPVFDCPVVLGEWTVTGDEGRELVHRGGSASRIAGDIPESAASWMTTEPEWVVAFFGLAALGMVIRARWQEGWRNGLALMIGAAVIFAAIALSVAAVDGDNAGGALVYSAPALAADEALTVEVANLPPWRARTGWKVWLPLAIGVGLLGFSFFVKRRGWAVAGIALVAAALLAVRGGASLFFAVFAVGVCIWLLPRLVTAGKSLRRPRFARSAATTAALTAIWLGAAANESQAAEAGAIAPAESMIHDWQIRDGRLRGTVDVVVRAEPGDRFLLLVPPAILGAFEGDGLRVIKGPHDGADAYFLVAEAGGRLGGRAEFEMPLADPKQAWKVPSGPAALRRVQVSLDRPGWEFVSAAAAQVLTDAGDGEGSSATLLLGPAEPAEIAARPQQRDPGKEETRFFAEISSLFLPGAGVVNGHHRVVLRPAQGRVSTIRMQVPQGWVVSDVVDGPISQWRFDPATGELRATAETAQEETFGFTVKTQQSTGRLPVDLALAPLRVLDAAGEVGTLAVAFADDARLVSTQPEGLSRVNVEESWRNLLPEQSEFEVQQAYRYGSDEAVLQVRVGEVEPELRAAFSQLISIGEDRLVVALDLAVEIKRSGLFRLAVEVPAALEIESVTGDSLAHWSESSDDNGRLLVLNLTGKLLGTHLFRMTLAGQAPGAQESWEVPHLALRGASREEGRLVVVPERGLQVRAVARQNVSQADPRTFTGEVAGAAARPGALAFRLLSEDWQLQLGIDRLDPWVTAQVYHEASLREGQMLEKLGIGYRIENAAVKSVRLRIPDLDEEAAGTVRATGSAIAEIIPVADSDGLWEIRFERAMAGNAEVRIEYQRRRDESETAVFRPLILEDVRQTSYFAAIRAGGHLEVESGDLPRGWERTDWAVVQATIGQMAAGETPHMTFRVSDSESSLPLNLKRHELATTRKVRVAEAFLTSLVAPAGQALTAVDLKLEMPDKSTLRMTLPQGAELFNVLVNDEGATLVQEGDAWLFHVSPSPDPSKPATARFVFSSPAGKNPNLEGPVIDVPMENITWRVLVPEGWSLASYEGDFDLKHRRRIGSFDLQDYRSLAAGKHQSDSQDAVALLDQANVWLRAGDQERASLALSNATRTNLLDEASNEDARIQLRQLKTQQAVLGVNTRRQRMAYDNRQDTAVADNSQLERAARANPLLQGEANFDPQDFDRFMEGNSADENAALKEIGSRIVAQQLAAEPAPAALDVTLPERGTIFDFSRSVQIEGEDRMAIQLHLKRTGNGAFWLGLLGCLTVAGLAATSRSGGLRSARP